MLTVVADPPDTGHHFDTGAAGAGNDFLAAAGGAFFRCSVRFPALLDVLLFSAVISRYRLPYSSIVITFAAQPAPVLPLRTSVVSDSEGT